MNLIRKIGSALGVNLTVVSLSAERMADGIGNSILYVIIPLYVDKLPEKLIPLPNVFLIGILISAYGFATAGLQPFMAALSDRIGKVGEKCRLTAWLSYGRLVAG